MDFEYQEPPKHIGKILLAMVLFVMVVIGVAILNSFKGLYGGLALAYAIVMIGVALFFSFFILVVVSIGRQVFTFRNSPEIDNPEASR
ncbi:MAG: hypothetical protein KGL77_05590 [Actinomycetales bacterium]|nr:hypothetical protein [Actinomycetales bacterium]